MTQASCCAPVRGAAGPRVAFVYSDEVWTGIQYQVGASVRRKALNRSFAEATWPSPSSPSNTAPRSREPHHAHAGGRVRLVLIDTVKE